MSLAKDIGFSSDQSMFKCPRDNVILGEGISESMKNLREGIRVGTKQHALDLITVIKERSDKLVFLQHSNEEETILHAAIKMRAHKDVISALVDACPELLNEARDGSELYKGQTALHIAITGDDIETIEMLLSKATSLGPKVLNQLLNKTATGSRFQNTVMLGELPLAVAILKLNTKVLDRLLEYHADLDGRNSRGDNVCHCLIRYAHLYPEKLPEIMTMLEHICKLTNAPKVFDGISMEVFTENTNDLEKANIQVWLMENKDGLNPLQLAACLGQQQIFKFLMEMKGVYCYVNSEDGLFDVELYDVTDIDTISELELKLPKLFPSLEKLNINSETKTSDNNLKQERANKIPTLEMIFYSDPAIVFKFIHMSPLRYVINRKWAFYRWFYAVWGVLHMLFMVGFTVYAVRRATMHQQGGVNNNETDTHPYDIGEDAFVTVYVAMSLLVAILYSLQEVIRMLKGRMPWTVSHAMNCYHNGPFRLVLVLFSLTVFADFAWRMADPFYGNYLLVSAMILGWWFIVFFLRAMRQFSFFTVMIQKVLVGDMFRFSIVIGMELVAFTTGLYIAFQGSNSSDENVSEYSKLMVLMFKSMFGFSSIDVLYEAKHPWFAVCLYVAFVLLTYVLMINSLIAMMSNTCAVVSQNRDIQYRVQQLSIILFFESVLPPFCLHLVGHPRHCDWYDSERNSFVRKQRYFMEVRSLHEVTKSKSRHRPNPETMLETIFQTIKSIPISSLNPFESEKEIEKDKVKPVRMNRETLRNSPEDENDIKITETTVNATDSTHKKKEKSKKKHKKRSKKEKDDGGSADISNELCDTDVNRTESSTYTFGSRLGLEPLSPVNVPYSTLEIHPFANSGEDDVSIN